MQKENYFKGSRLFTGRRDHKLAVKKDELCGLYNCTYRKHFEDLQPIRSPAFLGFVDWQREVNISGILREEQH